MMRKIGTGAAILALFLATHVAPATAQTMDGLSAMPAAGAPLTGEAAGAAAAADESAAATDVMVASALRTGGGSNLLLQPTFRSDLEPANRSGPAVDALAVRLRQPDRRRGLTLVLVGGALIGAGLLIDGDAGAAVSVGGALLGGYGVYLMVRQ
jgi:hypothetical protein